MSRARRELQASINGMAVGTLREETGLWSFEYETSWAESPQGFDLAPNLPRASGRIIDEGTQRPVQWFFDNLLPEEAAREVLARDAKLSSADAFGLLTYFGKESAGALTLLPPGESQPATGLQPLSNDELHDRIAGLPRRALATGAPKRMSLAGAQHKMAVCVRDGALFHPVGSTPSTHILKPDHVDTDRYPYSVANEYFVMQLAARMELDVPPVEIRHVPDPVYFIERFDRVTQGAETRRLHAIDACQLLGLDRTFKYQQARAETLVRCIDRCQNRAQARQELLRWALFNVMVGNGDAHLKNISFLVGPEGIRLAPFYDLVSSECYHAPPGKFPRWPEVPLSMPMGDAGTFGAVTRESIFGFAEELGASRAAASRVLDDLLSGLDRSAEALYERFMQLQIPLPVICEGELRVLRSIHKIVIREMLAQVRGAERAS